MTHHRYINLGIGLEPAGVVRRRGERDKPPTAAEKRRALRAAKKALGDKKIDGYKIVDVVDPATFNKSKSR